MPYRLLFLIVLWGSIPSARAHYHMLLPDRPSVKKGEEVTLAFQYGHPFEHELSNTSKPQQTFVVTPGGKRIDLSSKLEEASTGARDTKATIFLLKYTPEERGDHLVVVRSAPHTPEGKKEPVYDIVKTVIHVEAQKNWHQSMKSDTDSFELLPLTRPYGIRSGMVFRIALEKPNDGGAAKNVLVEIERYNPFPPKELPADEHITYTVRTDATGTAAMTLPEPGWWGITAVGEKHRGTLWVHVDEKISRKPNE